MRANFSLSGLHFIFLSTTKKVLVVKIIGTWYSETTQKTLTRTEEEEER